MHLVPKRYSLVAQTAVILRDGIKAGLWKDCLPGELALCRRLQVSRVTLRAALEQLEREGWCQSHQGRRRRINPRPTHSSSGPPSNCVVLLSPLTLQQLPASTLFWVDSLRDHLAAAGYRLEFMASAPAFSQHPERALETSVQEMRPAGWVLYLSNLQLQQWFLRHGLPCVVSGSAHTGIRLPSVDQDYAATCAHAVGLFAARGRQHIALLMPRSGQAGNLESERGFLEGIRRYPALRGQIVHHDGTVSAICNLLDRLMRSSSPVTGLLVAKPAHVTTTLTHLLRRGLRLPGDISLLSRDDDPLLETLVPVISRYHLEPGAFARKISRLVLGVLGNSVQANTTVRLMPALIKGETLGPTHSS